jgi:adenosylcobinamide kinase/adenosylcobinamide-phosphate guanylyltransferase
VALILVGGGSRSGKSRYALELARARGSRLAFVATAQALDEEMRTRISAHRRERGLEFQTVEEPIDVTGALRRLSTEHDAIVIDCLTLWLSNLLLDGQRDIDAEIARLIEAVNIPTTVIAVTNEIGCGIVPDNEMARRFRDLAGAMNQRVAAAAAEAYWMAFGYPLRVK